MIKTQGDDTSKRLVSSSAVHVYFNSDLKKWQVIFSYPLKEWFNICEQLTDGSDTGS